MAIPQPHLTADRVGDILVTHRALSQAQAQEAADHAETHGLRFGEAAVALGLIDEGTLRETLNLHFALSRVLDEQPSAARIPIGLAETAAARGAEIRMLRNRIAVSLRLPRPDAPAIAVVGPNDHAGASMIAAHLALSFAGVGYRTLLIDGDLERGMQRETFQLAPNAGLADYLEGSAAAPLLQGVPGIDHLAILSAGASIVSAGDLLLRPQLHRLFAAARFMFDVILVDTPAADQGRDYLLLAAECGQALVVTRQGHTKRRDVHDLAAACEAAGVSILGATMVGRDV